MGNSALRTTRIAADLNRDFDHRWSIILAPGNKNA